MSLPSGAFSSVWCLSSPRVAFPSRRFAFPSLGSGALLYHSNGQAVAFPSRQLPPSPPVAFPPVGLPSLPSGPVHCCTTAMETCGRHVEKNGLRGACGCPKPPLRCPKPRESQKNRFFLKKSGENICTVQGAVVILHRFSAHEDLFRVERFF